MANRSKSVGTKFETAVCRYLRERLGDDHIERTAPCGPRDEGDIHGLFAHGHEGIAECKCHRTCTEGDLAEWRRQTLRERGNRDADFALLVVRRPGCNYEDATARRFGLHDVHVTVEDLLKIAGVTWGTALYRDALDEWVTLPLAECCGLISGVVGDGG